MILIFELEWSLRQRQEDNYMVGRLGYYIVVVFINILQCKNFK